ncbi:SusC/RagA family TonB-linked outer membrane protein [Chitinophaga caeni]|uniref:SusC/RagA family TonB-linked outer membrane protein n=1 Tax=Chitinophaga caeni TaxID=2029983 RepID=A0A291QPU7_9BACT|nr:SusC/RagA family TonB-linked outer membrane protein [Chitinophaga caeni]ATL45923.1 SusC/RagA family TonB-linked outer membrane protein [Chitinophaga caeni]
MYQQYILSRKAKGLWALLVAMMIMGHVAAQQKMVTMKGIAYEKSTNTPIPGLGIYTGKPLKPIAATAADGSFSITVPEGAEVVFRSISYAAYSIKAKEGAKYKIMMAEQQSKLKETVIIGYQKKSREVVSGATTLISGKELQDVPVANVMELMQGKVAGLNIQNNTGAPGYAGTIQMRGLNSIAISGSGSEAFLRPTSPLFIIDGVPVDPNSNYQYGFDQAGPGLSPLSLIPPEDIESIQVLKDAQATALYGSRGAYGVILVTTKRGKSKVPIVQYTGNFFVSIPPTLRPVIGGQEERRRRINQYMEYTDSLYKAAEIVNETPFLSDSLNPFYNNSTNWQGLFYDYAYNQTHNLIVSGGDDRFNYKANVGYYNEKGIMKNTGFERYALSTNMTYRPTQRLRVFSTISTSLGLNKKGSGNGLLQTDVAKAGAQSSLMPAPSFYSSSASAIAALRTDNNNKTANVRTSLDVDYELFPGLHVANNVSFENQSATEENFVPAAINSNFSSMYSFYDKKTIFNNRASLSYFKTVNNVHNFTIAVFNELNRNTYQANTVKLERTPSDDFKGPYGNDGYYSRGGVMPGSYDERIVGNAATFSYNYDQMYVLDLSYRLDASSTSGKKTPYSNNPSIGLRWNFNRLRALSTSTWLDYGAIRATWGKNVTPQGDIFDAYGIYTDRNGARYNDQPVSGIEYENLPNNDLKPVTNTTLNFGFDMGLWRSRITGTFDFYVKDVDNSLYEIDLPDVNGFNKVKSNDLAWRNIGFEYQITARLLPSTSEWNMTFSLNGSYVKDRITRLPNGKREMYYYDKSAGQDILYRVGKNALTNVLYNTTGVYATDADVPVNPVTGKPVVVKSVVNDNVYYTPLRGGDPIWTDMNGDYIIDEHDRVYAGNSQPLVNGGASLFVQYKNYSLNIYGAYIAYRKILNNAIAERFASFSKPSGNLAMVPIDEYNYWEKAGDKATYPNPYDYARSPYVRPYRIDQTLFEEDGSYFKINQITFSYNFDRAKTRRYGVTSARVYATVYNMFMFSNYSGPNPENVTALGRDQSGGYPARRSVTVGLSVQF